MADTPNASVEERIVEMRFDNKQFEEGVKTTMSTLEKFKNALNFNNSEKGIEKIQNNLNSFNLSAAISGLDGFSSKLSGLEIFSKRIVENIADSVYSGIRKVEQGLDKVFNQIETGGERRAQNIEQAKFQLTGLGIAWEDIEDDINYGVKSTAYGLDSAARIAAQLSASNVAIGDEMKAALRGVSGVAAMTNSTYDDIGRIFTQVAGAGRLYTQDMLQMSSRGLNIAAALGKQLGKTEAEIREMVTRGQIDFKTFSTAMNDAFGDQAKKANDTYSGSLSNVNAALSRIGADVAAAKFEALRKVFVDLIPKIDGFKKAMKPVETVLNDIIGRIGETLQSIVSRIDVEAVAKKISPILIGIGNTILWLISQIDGLIAEFDRIKKKTSAVLAPGLSAAKQAEEAGKKIAAALDKNKKPLEEIAELSDDAKKAFQAAQDIYSKGLFGNGQERIDALKEAGIDPELTQKIIEEYLANGQNWDEAVKKATEGSKEVTEQQEKEEKKAIALNNVIKNIALTFHNLKRIASNVFESVGNVLSVVVSTIKGSFTEESTGEFFITKLTGKIADLSDKFLITKERAEKLRKPLSFIINIIKSIIKVISTAAKVIGGFIVTVVDGIVKIAKRITDSKTFRRVIDGIGDAINGLKDTIVDLVDRISKSSTLKSITGWLKRSGAYIIEFFGGAIEYVIRAVDFMIPKIADAGRAVVGFFSSIGSTVKNSFSTIKNSFSGLFGGSGNDAKASLFSKIAAWVEDTFSFLFDKDGKSIIGRIIDWISGFVKWIGGKVKQLSAKDIWTAIKEIAVIAGAGQIVAVLHTINKTIQGLPGLLKSIEGAFKGAKRVNTAQAILAVAKSFVEFAKAVAILVGAVIALALVIAQGAEYEEAVKTAVSSLVKIMLTLGLVIGVVEGIKTLLSYVDSKKKKTFKMPLVLQISSLLMSIGMVLNAIRKLASLSEEDFKTGVERLKTLGVILGIFFVAIESITAVISIILKKFDASFEGVGSLGLLLLSFAGSIVALSLAFVIFAGVSKLVGPSAAKSAADAIRNLILTMGIMMTLIIGVTEALYDLSNSSANGGTAIKIEDVLKSVAANFIAIAVAVSIMSVALGALAIVYKLIPKEASEALLTIIALIGMVSVVISAASKGATNQSAKAIGHIWPIFLTLAGFTVALTSLAETITTQEQAIAIAAALLGLAAIMWSLSKVMEAIGDKKPNVEAIDASIIFMGSLVLMTAALQVLNGEDWAGYLAALSGMALVVLAMSKVMEAIGDKKPNKAPIFALGVAFAGLGAMIVPLIWLKQENMGAIAAAAVPLAAAITPFIFLVKEIGAQNVKAAPIFALGIAFAALGAMLVPLIWLKQENMGAIISAGGTLVAVIGVLIGMVAVLSKAAVPLAVGGAIAIMAGGIAILAWALGEVSNNVDPSKLAEVAITVGLLGLALAAIIVILSKVPVSIVIILELTAAIIAIGAAITLVTLAIGWLMEKLPNAAKNLQVFTYALGTLPGLFIKGLFDGFTEGKKEINDGMNELAGEAKDTLGINSPSKVFIEIGKYCIEGLLQGLLEGLAEIPKKIVNALKTHIIEPVKEFFDINSPSKVFAKIGDFCGQGLSEGLMDSIGNIDISSVLSGITDGAIDGIGDFSDLGSIAGMNFTDGLEGALGNGIDTSGLGDSLGLDLSGGIIETQKEQLKGIDWTKIFSLNDLINDENIYNQLKEIGEAQLTAAYEEYKEYMEFITNNPTEQAYVNNIADNYDAMTAQLYKRILESGNNFQKHQLETMLMSDYIDKSKMSENVRQYMSTWETALDEEIKNIESKEYNKRVQDAITKSNKEKLSAYGLSSTGEQYVTMHFQTPDGQSLDSGVNSFMKKGYFNIEFDESQMNARLTQLGNDIMSDRKVQTEGLMARIVTELNNQKSAITGLNSKFDEVTNSNWQVANAIDGMQVRIDSGPIVGAISSNLDHLLGRKQKIGGRQ